MRAIFTIAEREFRALVTAPIGYVVMMFFLFVSGVFFLAPLQQNVANIRYVVGNTVIWLVFLLPALTMRLLAEEKKQGTIELLMTSPVTEAQVVLGKYLGVLAYYAVILFSMLQFVFVLGMVRKSDAQPFFPTYTGLILSVATLVTLTFAALNESRVLGMVASLLAAATLICSGFAAAQMGEWGPVVTGYLGLFMIGAVFLAIGVLASGLTSNQIIAWVSTAAVLLLLTVLISWLTGSMPPTPPTLEADPNFGSYVGFAFAWLWYMIGQVLQALNLQAYLENFAQGVLDLRDFILYLSLIVVSLFFAVRGLTVSRAA
jgi:ABC-2 type transport system permease protein